MKTVNGLAGKGVQARGCRQGGAGKGVQARGCRQGDADWRVEIKLTSCIPSYRIGASG